MYLFGKIYSYLSSIFIGLFIFSLLSFKSTFYHLDTSLLSNIWLQSEFFIENIWLI